MKNFVEQPPLYHSTPEDMTVAISSLSLGGAEKIVVDWLSRIYPKWRPHLIVLRDRQEEWPLPDHVRITRLHGKNMLQQLRVLGGEVANSRNPVCVCHLLNKDERSALSRTGAKIISVIHNAKSGWLESVDCLAGSASVVAVSEDCARSLRDCGWNGSTSVVRHIPSLLNLDPTARETLREQWRIPKNALVIGMIGAVKPQKNYPMALQVLKKFLETRDAYLVILGGPVNTKKGKPEWINLVREINRLGVRHRVALPGFVPNAPACLPAFDVFLNTSFFEGLSIATLEALIHGIPVVASKVGGQGELTSPGLVLLDEKMGTEEWAMALSWATRKSHDEVRPKWFNFPSYRLWSLTGIARSVKSTGKLLFVTANLNSGGAQRSLVNLTKMMVQQKVEFEVAVTGNSTSDHFYRELREANVQVSRIGESPWDAFEFAENLVHKICSEDFEKVCFWNVNAMIKLLSVKALHSSNVQFTEVSPGDFLYEEMDETVEFQKLIAFSSSEYFKRIDHLVLKYAGSYPEECVGKTSVIRNGVPLPARVKTDYRIGWTPKVVVCGRIAPTKYAVEIIKAMQIVHEDYPNAEVHFYGAAESYHQDYMDQVMLTAGEDVDKTIFFHGFEFDASDKLPDYDVFVVLGKHQGCPNSLLEALSVGMPCIANNDGGTFEQIIPWKTGFLFNGTRPADLAYFIKVAFGNEQQTKTLGINGRQHVLKNFSMKSMLKGYMKVLGVKHSAFDLFLNRLTEFYNSLVSGVTSRKEQHDGIKSYSLQE